jgi:hypothetical protein
MLFLDAKHISAIDLIHAKPGSLFLAAHPVGYVSLLTRAEPILEIVLTGEGKWRSEGQEYLESMRGVAIEDATIQIDAASISTESPSFGSIYRVEKRLMLVGKKPTADNRLLVCLADDLPDCGKQETYFRTWRIVRGVGDDLQILWSSHDTEAKK